MPAPLINVPPRIATRSLGVPDPPALPQPAAVPEPLLAAELELPTGASPGFLRMPDGRLFRIINGLSPAPANAPAGSSAGSGQGGLNGTNPAENVTTFSVSNEFYRLTGGNEINTTYARFKFPIFANRGSFLLETPLAFYDFTATNPLLPELGGLGDMKFQVGYDTFVSQNKRFTMINFLEFFVPSADNAAPGLNPGGNQLTAFNLGTGRYVLGPGLGMVFAIQPNFTIAPLYFYEASVGGNEDRVSIRPGKWRIFAMYACPSGMYMLPELQVLTNYLTGDNDSYFAPEVGYSTQGTTLYVKPGFGFDPDRNNREWGIEFDTRIQF